jgi:hypothetical protein
MPRDLTLSIYPQQAINNDYIRSVAAKKLGIKPEQMGDLIITRKSIDARKKDIKVNIAVRVFESNEAVSDIFPKFNFCDVRGKAEVLVVGAGPAGLFASLRLIELGLKPIIIERGKEVSQRKRDVAMLNKNLGLNTESNYAFGEGGAGTFSDGKLYSRSRKRGDINRILKALQLHGAQDEILYEAHPHIGTNILPRVVTSIRKTIEQYGGEFIFNSKVEKIILSNGKAKGVLLSDGGKIYGIAVILATGHSAREVYFSLHQQGIQLESKPFAMGVRVEHPQELIDRIQYHGEQRGQFLPPASYRLVHQIDGRGVYSFCMCPGGYIVPAVSSVNELVVNGMSPSHRGSRWANSGIVVEIQLGDLAVYSKYGPLAGLVFQKELEELAFNHVKRGVVAPAQRITDFINGKLSANLPTSSYYPGISSSRIDEWLPGIISSRLRQGFIAFDRKMKGFITQEAQLLGVESRTSSPVRIPRDQNTLQHIAVEGLYPCGEGAGYAGGIVSSAIDGERCAEALAQWIDQH